MGSIDEYDLLEQQLEGSGADKDKKEKDRKESRSHKHSDRDREKDRSKHDDRKRSRSRRRTSSRDRKKRSRSRSKGARRDKDRSRDAKRRSRSPKRRSRSRRRRSPVKRERTPPRAPTPPEVREQRERERELMELDRDIRTIFAYNLPLKATEQDLFNFFATAGKIVDVKIIMDRNTRRSKGFAYIEYAQREDIVKAMGLTGQILMGQAVMVKSSEAEKNLAWEAAQAQAAAMNQLNSLTAAGQGPCKLQVSNLHPNIMEGDLRGIFEPFGALEALSVQRESGGRQNVAFVTYTLVSDATKAMQQLDQMEIADQKIGVKIAPMSAQETAQLAAAASRVDLDDEDEGGGMRMNSSARAALMNRLAGTSQPGGAGPQNGAPQSMAMPTQLPPPPAQSGPTMSAPARALMMEQGVLGPACPRPTLCVLLKNMFDPTQETAPEWDKEIMEDVREECSKFGSITHIYVDRNSKGFVYLKFATMEGALAAQQSLHGRWFAGNQVVAEFQFQQPYTDYFRCQ